MHVIQDVHDVSTDNRVAEHILGLHRRGHSAAPAPSHMSTLDLQRYIRLARTFNPKITPEAKEKLIRCYKKLREDRTYVRGSAGVTVRQLESLMRLSEAVARVHLDDKVRVEYVVTAFDLQMNSLKRVERESIDLNPEMAEEAPAADAAGAAPGDGAAAEPSGADKARARKMKITYAEYQRIGMMLATYLARQEEKQELVTEDDLTTWYMEQIEEDLQTEAQLFEAQHLVQLVINRLVDKDRVIIVYRPSEDPNHPEHRVLVKHPNFAVGEAISGRHAAA